MNAHISLMANTSTERVAEWRPDGQSQGTFAGESMGVKPIRRSRIRIIAKQAYFDEFMAPPGY